MVTLAMIMHKCYPSDLAEELCLGIKKLWALSINQRKNGDLIGADVKKKKKLFNSLKI